MARLVLHPDDLDLSLRDPVIEAARKETLREAGLLRSSGGRPRCPHCQEFLSDQTRGVWVCQTCKLK